MRECAARARAKREASSEVGSSEVRLYVTKTSGMFLIEVSCDVEACEVDAEVCDSGCSAWWT